MTTAVESIKPPPEPPKDGRRARILAAAGIVIAGLVAVLMALDVDVCGFARAAGIELVACRSTIVPASPAPPARAPAADGGAP